MNLFFTNPSPIPTAKYGLIQKFKGLKPQICDLSPIPTAFLATCHLYLPLFWQPVTYTYRLGSSKTKKSG